MMILLPFNLNQVKARDGVRKVRRGGKCRGKEASKGEEREKGGREGEASKGKDNDGGLERASGGGGIEGFYVTLSVGWDKVVLPSFPHLPQGLLTSILLSIIPFPPHPSPMPSFPTLSLFIILHARLL